MPTEITIRLINNTVDRNDDFLVYQSDHSGSTTTYTSVSNSNGGSQVQVTEEFHGRNFDIVASAVSGPNAGDFFEVESHGSASGPVVEVSYQLSGDIGGFLFDPSQSRVEVNFTGDITRDGETIHVTGQMDRCGVMHVIFTDGLGHQLGAEAIDASYLHFGGQPIGEAADLAVLLNQVESGAASLF